MSKKANVFLVVALLHLVGLAVVILAYYRSTHSHRAAEHAIGTPINRIPPGVRIAPDSATPWSHLVIRVEPYRNRGDIDRLSPQLKQAIESFCILLVATVDAADPMCKSGYRRHST
jgi:hypothetical protein